METHTIYQKREKLKNKYNLFKFISKIQTFTKLDISLGLNLSIPTVSKIIDDFLDENLVTEIGYTEGGLGRKSTIYSYNANAFYSVGILIETTGIKLLIVNLNGYEIKKTILKNIQFTDQNFQIISKEIISFINNFEFKDLIKGVGLSTSAIKLKNSTYNILIENLKKEIEKNLKVKVHTDRIAKTGAICEYTKSSDKNFAFLNIGNDIHDVEVALVIEGKPLGNGKFAQAISPDISNNSLIKEYEYQTGEKISDYHELFGEKILNSKYGTEIFYKYIEYLSHVVNNIQIFSDVEKIIIGGSIAKYSKELEEYLPFKNLEFSETIEDSPLIGAAFLPLKEYFL
ncbi:ROK family protein [Cetobacterium sp. SF1]|uniref:ROK family protein n=1 Tax=Cetobacterium sp. SF1 TaxID=3417654 RepID=UPI003CF59F36